MRRKLAKRKGKRLRFRATFLRYGWRNGLAGKKQTALLIDIEDEGGEMITGHVWMNDAKPFIRLDLEEGDRVEFWSSVEWYIRRDGTKDWKPGNPHGIRRIED